MNSYTVLDPLGAQAVHRPGHLLGHATSYIFKFYLFLASLCNFNSLLDVGPFSFGGRH
jgi:hypothetical protein